VGDLSSTLSLSVEDDTIGTRGSYNHCQHDLDVSHMTYQLTTGVDTTSPQWELLVRAGNKEVKALVVVVLVRVRRAAGLGTLLVVRITLAACCRDLGAGVADVAALDVALPGLNLSLDGSCDLSGDGSRKSKDDGRQEDEKAGDKLHDCDVCRAKDLGATRDWILAGPAVELST
jgi:hypothetical protein